jgi:FtsP/CotA-like multicopper oxidase with cupredoxin domain
VVGGAFSYYSVIAAPAAGTSQAGTFWYHGHGRGMDRVDGMYGAFIVDPKTKPTYYTYDEERSVSRWGACIAVTTYSKHPHHLSLASLLWREGRTL